MNWLEESPLEFDTPMGPAWPAAKYLAVCAWPDNQSKRTLLVRALLRVAAEAAGYKYPWYEHRNRVLKRIDRASYRFEKHGMRAAEKARLKGLPHEWNIPVTWEHTERYRFDKFEPGILQVVFPNHRAVGQHRQVSDKRLDFLAGKNWNFRGDSSETVKGDANFRKETWIPFRPAVPYIIGLQNYFYADEVLKKYRLELGQIPDFVTLCRNTEWLEPALASAERWATDILPNDAEIPTDQLIRLFRTP